MRRPHPVWGAPSKCPMGGTWGAAEGAGAPDDECLLTSLRKAKEVVNGVGSSKSPRAEGTGTATVRSKKWEEDTGKQVTEVKQEPDQGRWLP